MRTFYLFMVAAVLGAVLYFANTGQRFSAPAASTTAVPTPAVPTISGRARVIDGDTVVVAGIHVRLKGVDAAELGSPLGEHARQVMIGIVSSDLACRLTGEKTYGREVGFCTTSDGIDINRTIIEQGAALSCPRFDAQYLKFEQAAALAAQPRSAYCVKRSKI